MITNIEDYKKAMGHRMVKILPPPEDQEVRAEVLQARINWLEEVIENQWKQIAELRKMCDEAALIMAKMSELIEEEE